MNRGIDLKALDGFLSSIKFPVTAGELAKQAETAGITESAKIFLADIDSDLELPSKDEVMERAKEVSILMEGEEESPTEQPRSNQE